LLTFTRGAAPHHPSAVINTVDPSGFNIPPPGFHATELQIFLGARDSEGHGTPWDLMGSLVLAMVKKHHSYGQGY